MHYKLKIKTVKVKKNFYKQQLFLGVATKLPLDRFKLIGKFNASDIDKATSTDMLEFLSKINKNSFVKKNEDETNKNRAEAKKWRQFWK